MVGEGELDEGSQKIQMDLVENSGKRVIDA